jgi:hypothetical protein
MFEITLKPDGRQLGPVGERARSVARLIGAARPGEDLRATAKIPDWCMLATALITPQG